MIEVKNLSFSYGREPVLENVSFSLKKGECMAVLGNNGTGKSTLITCLNRIRHPASGQVFIDGEDVLKLGRTASARRIAYVAQKNELSHMTVFDCVLLGRKPYMKWGMTQQDLHICETILERMEMTAFRLRYMDELSGGELQKIMLARSLVQQPELLLLDEPTSNLDPKNQYEMLSLVRTLAKERQFGVILVIHDLALALRYCDRFLLMKDGQVYASGDGSIITPQALMDVYGIRAKLVSVDGHIVPIVE